jgi:hypothetical protein
MVKTADKGAIRGVENLVRELWRYTQIDVKLGRGEVAELRTYDGGVVLETNPLTDQPAGWIVSAIVHRPDEMGMGKRIRKEHVFIPYNRWFEYDSRALLKHVEGYIGLLAAMCSTKKPPKGWRLFGRRRR